MKRNWSSVSNAAQHFDVVLIGSGVIGCSLGLELTRRGFKTCNIDSNRTVGYGTTSYSSGIIRTYYSGFDAVKVAAEGLHYWKNWGDHVKHNQDLVTFRQTGGLLIENPATQAFIDKVLPSYDALNIPYERLHKNELNRRFPWLNLSMYGHPKPVDDETFGEVSGEAETAIYIPETGYISDPQLAVNNLQIAMEKEGGSFRLGSPVTEICRDSGRVSGVKLASGETIHSPIVVNCAGAQSDLITSLAFPDDSENDMRFRTKPLRVEVAYVPSPPGVNFDKDGVMVADFECGVYLRPEVGNKILIGGTEPECDTLHYLDDPDGIDENLTPEVYDANLIRASLRINDLPFPNTASGVVSMYDTSPDWVPIYDGSSLPGYYMAIGTSGNQFKNASVVGHLMASLIEHSETKIKMVHSGFEVDMSKYSRLRKLGKTANVLA